MKDAEMMKEKFKMHLKSNKVNVIKILPGGVVTAKDTAEIQLDAQGEFVRNPEVDIVKVAVVERHQGTGIPEIKLTDMGLFDVTTFSFTSVEAE